MAVPIEVDWQEIVQKLGAQNAAQAVEIAKLEAILEATRAALEAATTD